MGLFHKKKKKQKQTANIARERLQIIVSHQRQHHESPEYLADLQQDILEVVKKYVKIQADDVRVEERMTDDSSQLELNIALPQHNYKIKCDNQDPRHDT